MFKKREKVTFSSQVSVDTNHRYDVVAFHPGGDIVIHGQPGRLPHRGEDGVAHRVRRGPGQADQDQVWLPRVGLHEGFLQGLKDANVLEDARFHGVPEEPKDFHAKQQGGGAEGDYCILFFEEIIICLFSLRYIS